MHEAEEPDAEARAAEARAAEARAAEERAAEERAAEERAAEERVQSLSPLSLTPCEKALLFWPGSGPRTQDELDIFRKVIVRRYTWERALKFTEDTSTRFLNKARGLITFNGLTPTTFGTLIKAGGPTTQVIPHGCLALALALRFYLQLFYCGHTF